MAVDKQGNRSRVLHLLKYLYEFSDEENQKTIAQLIQELSENDLKGNRVTILNNPDLYPSPVRGREITNPFCRKSRFRQ